LASLELKTNLATVELLTEIGAAAIAVSGDRVSPATKIKAGAGES